MPLCNFVILPCDNPAERVGSAKVDPDDLICDVRNISRAAYPKKLKHVDADELVIWKCSIPFDELNETIKTLRFGEDDSRIKLLNPLSTFSECFSDDPDSKSVHIIVQITGLEDISTPLIAPLYRVRILELAKQRHRFNNKISEKFPSTQVVPSQFAKIQANAELNIVWHRPPTADQTIPVTLYHSVFRQFVEDCDTHTPTKEDNALVMALSDAMSEFFANEALRAISFREVMRKHSIPFISTTLTPKSEKGATTDGDIQVDGHRISIVEVKNEVGSGGAEPYVRGILHYLYSSQSKSEGLPQFNFPCLIITIFGAHIAFSGAVWTDRPHYQVLTPSLPLFCHYRDTRMHLALARHIGAFKKAIRSLEKCYKALAHPSPDEDKYSNFPRYPDHNHYIALGTGAPVQFAYLSQMDNNKLLFMAETDDEEIICVKFTSRYSKEAHEKCALMGIAPKLRGFESLNGGWIMVVMDMIDATHRPLHEVAPPEGFYTDLNERLNDFHKAKFVHGDIRDTNILVRKDRKPGFMLVDFDWAGVSGIVRYPMYINKGPHLWRPDEVFDGELIKPEHDMAMLARLFVLPAETKIESS